MPKREIRFIGLLANTDSSILNLNSLDRGFKDRGFKVETGSSEEVIELISNLTTLEDPHCRTPLSEKQVMDEHIRISHKLTRMRCLNHFKVYFISKSYERNLEGRPVPILPPECDSDGKHVMSLVRLMRLFKIGNICLPLSYYYYTDKLKPNEELIAFYDVENEPYILERSEIPDLQRFIQDTKLPFKEPFLRLAFENFELSYQNSNWDLSFLTLMISLEALFGGGTYRISRNTATLLGQNKEDSKKIFDEVRQMYIKRSTLVHGGKRNIITKDDLLKLRHYVRASIKEINKIGKNKDDLLVLLDSSGFGERPWAR